MKITVNNHTLDLSTPVVMGILNVTPDSFYDGGKYKNVNQAIDHVSTMIKKGAKIIDVGGESTRPNSCPISVEIELERVIPIVSALSKRFKIFISVDTSKQEVMQESILSGAHMINDIFSLRKSNILPFLIKKETLICLTHMKGNPKNMQDEPKYNNIIKEVYDFLKERTSYLEKIGVKKSRLLIDPGFGFGKTLMHNYYLLSHLSDFHNLNFPILVGMSRKSMIGKLIHKPPKECLIGSISCSVIAAMQKVNIIRTHDVEETVEALKIVTTYLKAKEKKFFYEKL